MQALMLEKPREFRFVDVPEPAEPAAGQAVVRVRAVGICGTDYAGYLGKMPFFSYPRIPGHELGVEVVAVGAGVANVRPGDRCCVEPYISCWKCYACRRGLTNCCEHNQTLGVHCDGGLRPLFTVPAEKGDVRNLTNSPGSRERSPAWSPDGKWIACWSDASGDYQLTILSADGKLPARQVTRDQNTYPYSIVWSPDSKKIATFQQDQRGVGMMYLTRTKVGHPELSAWPYPLPGDSIVTMIQTFVCLGLVWTGGGVLTYIGVGLLALGSAVVNQIAEHGRSPELVARVTAFVDYAQAPRA